MVPPMDLFRRVSFRSLPATLSLPALVLLAACQPSVEEHEPEESATKRAMLPLPQPPIDRAALLMAVAKAASATAAGIDGTVDQRALDGRPFELRIRFGCRGPSPDLQEAMFGWRLDDESGTLRVRATPTISSDEHIVQQIAGEDFEAVEGFWIPRPWLLQPVCPVAAEVTPAPAAPMDEVKSAVTGGDVSGETSDPAEETQETRSPPPAWSKVGIAEFFTEFDPRTRRRGMRPYETVSTVPAGQPIGSEGFNLVLSGRLRALPSLRVIACVSSAPDAPPDCIVSARVDRVRIERPVNGETLADWRAS